MQRSSLLDDNVEESAGDSTGVNFNSPVAQVHKVFATTNSTSTNIASNSLEHPKGLYFDTSDVKASENMREVSPAKSLSSKSMDFSSDEDESANGFIQQNNPSTMADMASADNVSLITHSSREKISFTVKRAVTNKSTKVSAFESINMAKTRDRVTISALALRKASKKSITRDSNGSKMEYPVLKAKNLREHDMATLNSSRHHNDMSSLQSDGLRSPLNNHHRAEGSDGEADLMTSDSSSSDNGEGIAPVTPADDARFENSSNFKSSPSTTNLSTQNLRAKMPPKVKNKMTPKKVVEDDSDDGYVSEDDPSWDPMDPDEVVKKTLCAQARRDFRQL